MWSKTPPTEFGWYWIKQKYTPNFEPAWFEGDISIAGTWISADDIELWWSKPIKPPKELPTKRAPSKE